MGTKHFTLKERSVLNVYVEKGLTQQKIASMMGRNQSSISRELARNRDDQGYDPSLAQIMYEGKQSNRKNHKKYNDHTKKLVERYLYEFGSPEAVALRLKLEGRLDITHKTIYRWLKDGKICLGDMRVLTHCGKPYRRKGKKPINRYGGKNIIERPLDIDERKEVGHWEADLIVSGDNQSTVIVTLVERKSRYLLMTAVPTKQADMVSRAIIDLLKEEFVITLTSDNGTEFAYHELIEEKLNIKMFYTNIHAPWEKGTNENTNGVIRRYFEKKVNLAQFSQHEVSIVQQRINTQPRIVLGGRTNKEVYLNQPILPLLDSS